MFWLRRNILLNPDGTAGGGSGDGNPGGAPGITADELHRAVEKARLEERTKLRNELDANKNSADAAKNELVALRTENENLKSQVATLTSDMATLKASLKAGSSNEIDVEALITKTAAESTKGLKEEIASLQSQLAAETAKRTSAEFETLKAQQIAEVAMQQGVSAELLSELVKGVTSPEELPSALEAKAGLLKKSLPASSTTQSGTAGAGRSNLPLPAAFVEGAGDSVAGFKSGDIRAMSDEEWKKNRTKILSSASGRYRSANPFVRS